MKYLKLIGALFLAIVLTACGSSGPEGTYTDKGGIEVTFQSNGKVIAKNEGSEMELSYELEGNKIKIKMGQGRSEIWTLEEDGSITVPDGGKLIKKK